jgi:hypothetical protein
MDLAFGVARDTPWWVYLVFALLVVLGTRALRPRVLSLYQISLTPAIFVLWGAAHFFGRPVSPLLLGIWLPAAAFGAVLGFTTTRIDGLRADRNRMLVHMPKSWKPLARNMLVFSCRYGLAVGSALHPADAANLILSDAGVAGASAGYFAGWLAKFILTYRTAPSFDLPAAGVPQT